MNKKLKNIMVMFLSTVVLSACAPNSGDQAGNQKEIEGYKSEISELKAQIKDLQLQLGSVVVGEIKSEEKTETSAQNGEIPLGLNQKIIINDIVEFSFTSVSWQNKILPSDKENYFTYKEAKPGETFLVLKGRLKNISGNSFSPSDFMEADFLINNKYHFYGSMDLEELDHKSFMLYLKPLQETDFYLLSSISNEMKAQFEQGTCTLKVLNDPSRLENYFYADKDPCNTYLMNLKP